MIDPTISSDVISWSFTMNSIDPGIFYKVKGRISFQTGSFPASFFTVVWEDMSSILQSTNGSIFPTLSVSLVKKAFSISI